MAPDTVPNRPAAQAVHDAEPATEYSPAPHTTPDALVDPAAHADPAEHDPSHWSDTRPTLDPKRPAAHGPEQPADVSPDVAPYSPAAHRVHVPDPTPLYLPAGHIAAVALVDPALHTYPALHDPLHDAVDKPDVAPYKPDAHMLHVPDPAIEYCPAGHSTAVALTDPDGHAYPALHAPVH